MTKLMKFEFMRKRLVLLIAFAAIIIGEAFAVIKYMQVDRAIRAFNGEMYFGVFAGVTGIALVILYLVDIVNLLRQDMFKQEGYMLFLTPNSGYKILGAKVIVALIEGLVFGLLYIGMMVLNANIFNIPAYSFMVEMDIESYWVITKVGLTILSGILEFAMTIFLAFALFKSIFVNVRFKGLITFGIFIGINIVKNQIINLFSNIFLGNDQLLMFNFEAGSNFIGEVHQVLNFSIGFSVLLSAILFMITGYLLEHKINL